MALAAGTAYRLFVAFPESSGHFEDLLEWASYGGVIRNLASGTPSPILGDSRGILLTWQILIAPILKLVGTAPRVLDWFGIIASIISTLLVFHIGRLLAGTGAGLAAAVFWAICRPAAHLATLNYSQVEPVFAVLGLFLTLKALSIDRYHIPIFFGAGLSLGLFHTVRPFVPVLPAACATLILMDRNTPRISRCVGLLAMGIGFCVPFSPLVFTPLSGIKQMASTWLRIFGMGGFHHMAATGPIWKSIPQKLIETLLGFFLADPLSAIPFALSLGLMWRSWRKNELLGRASFHVLLWSLLGIGLAASWVEPSLLGLKIRPPRYFVYVLPITQTLAGFFLASRPRIAKFGNWAAKPSSTIFLTAIWLALCAALGLAISNAKDEQNAALISEISDGSIVISNLPVAPSPTVVDRFEFDHNLKDRIEAAGTGFAALEPFASQAFEGWTGYHLRFHNRRITNWVCPAGIDLAFLPKDRDGMKRGSETQTIFFALAPKTEMLKLQRFSAPKDRLLIDAETLELDDLAKMSAGISLLGRKGLFDLASIQVSNPVFDRAEFLFCSLQNRHRENGALIVTRTSRFFSFTGYGFASCEGVRDRPGALRREDIRIKSLDPGDDRGLYFELPMPYFFRIAVLHGPYIIDVTAAAPHGLLIMSGKSKAVLITQGATPKTISLPFEDPRSLLDISLYSKGLFRVDRINLRRP